MITVRLANPIVQYGFKSYDMILFKEEEIVYRSSVNFKESESEESIRKSAEAIFYTLKLNENIDSILIDKPNGNI